MNDKFKEMITHFKDENCKSKKYKNYKLLSTLSKPVDTLAINFTTSTTATLAVIANALIVKATSTGVACGVTKRNKVIYELIKRK